MTPEYSAENVTRLVLAHLERRRYAIRADVNRARAEIARCLAPVRRAAADDDIPAAYMSALERELTEGLPERWCAQAERMTQLEQRDFDIWRGGDLVARFTYVLISLLVTAVFAATEAPAWGKLLALLASLTTFFVPQAQFTWYARAWERSLDDLARLFGASRLPGRPEEPLLLPAREGNA